MKIKYILSFCRKNKLLFIFFIITFLLFSFAVGSFVIDNCSLKICGKNSYQQLCSIGSYTEVNPTTQEPTGREYISCKGFIDNPSIKEAWLSGNASKYISIK